MQACRKVLKHSAVAAGLLAATGMFPHHAFAAFNKSAFEAKALPDVLKALGAGAPVESKDAAGKLVPAWHIAEVTATRNATAVLTAEWGPGVSKNPFLQFVVKGAKAGDKIAVPRKDNKGDSRTDEATAS